MDKVNYAAIDIGSNAVRLLIKSVVNEPDAVEPLSKVQLLRVPLRLGGDAFTKGKISKKKSKQLISLMKAYKEIMSIYDVKEYRACATSAMRDSSNGKKLVEEIREKTGIAIEIIDGEEEARLLSDDRVEKITARGGHFLYVDVGGGSTELNLVSEGQLEWSKSFNIGTVRLLSGMVNPAEKEAFIQFLEKVSAKYPEVNIIGTGGNINKLIRLAAPDRCTGQINLLPAEKLHSITEDLKSYTAQQRMARYNLKPDRADVIIPAADIFISIVDHLKAPGVLVPISGLADGIIDSIYLKDKNRD
ncbi:Guanosine-5'-triphosphate,3'-diphosphate pyrophosphatase [Porphyromonas macacae]|uniref:Guanosine-5'-triphosphate,3'-diphosphate pyrophosphatase n=1 Tax=Porphyromonas macacae TaxID=28115 RepID=A0A379E6W6_9PORP|nr:exopolyphosphatase [Porphyromonas macacae]SUB88180.1 Guanosine-5'-triphosphate,3'-diphosphate pyrophosphatase [Porphyromonas macacae]